MKNKEDQPVKVAAALSAIEKMGGSLAAAKMIQELTGKPCTRDRVQKWKTHGIGVPWHPIVHKLTGIPLPQLDPEIYPFYLFTS
jgi:hypothetical protein